MTDCSECPFLPCLFFYVVQASQSVRLFHREYECYISAEGSFAEDQQVVVEDGMLRVPVVSAGHDCATVSFSALSQEKD